jgi:hypothetical protein
VSQRGIEVSAWALVRDHRCSNGPEQAA